VNVRDAYSATSGAWQDGPGRIYDRLAEVLVARCPSGVVGGRVLDLGAGTGAVSRAAVAAGAASVAASDLAIGMLRHDARHRPPAVAGDAVGLPFAAGTFDAVVAAFSLNHLTDPEAGLVESARVLRRGGGLAASAYAEDDTHPAKAAVDEACRTFGWAPEPWIDAVRADAVPRLATVERAAAVASVLPGARVDGVREAFPELTALDLVEWRLGLAQAAPFVAALAPDDREALVREALDRLGDPPVLVRSFVVLTWTKP
jgi:SAM-dependent methyltransferase